MRFYWEKLACVCLVLGLSFPLIGEEKTAAPDKKASDAAAKETKPAGTEAPKKTQIQMQVDRRFELPSTITLTDEQKAKLEGVKKEFASKIEELLKKRESIFTKEQKAARRDATKVAREAGKKGKELQAAVSAAMKLTEEQQAKVTEVDKQVKEIEGKIREAVEEFLTTEQKMLLPKTKKLV